MTYLKRLFMLLVLLMMLMKAGATMLVAGSALYGAPDAKAFSDTIHAQYTELH